jgi:hypothetical protein
MGLPVNPFKRAIHAGEQQIGLWTSLASTMAIEIASGSGFDWLLLDIEHAPNELPMMVDQLRAMMESPAVAVQWNADEFASTRIGRSNCVISWPRMFYAFAAACSIFTRCAAASSRMPWSLPASTMRAPIAM